MANSFTTQILTDGPRNVTVKCEGVLDTSDLANSTVLDPALLWGIDNTGLIKASHLQIKEVMYNVEDLLEVRLFWDATTPKRIEAFTGRGKFNYDRVGRLTDNSGAGSTGKILVATEGWSAGKILSFAFTMECVKQQT
jgi:hypothetical protein